MSRSSRSRSSTPSGELGRISRPVSLVAQVEQLLRDALAAGRFPGGRLPTEVELAEQLGVSRETVRRATETLQREGLLVKFRRKGTFTHAPQLPERIEALPSTLIGYLQAAYPARDEEEAVTRAIGGQMLQGALEEAARAGLELVVRRAPHTQIGAAFRHLLQTARLRGVIFASFGEEKLLRQVTGMGLPTVLLDHDMHLPLLSSVRDDSFEGAREAVAYLASLGHRCIAFAGWHRLDLNPWRLTGYRQGLRDARLPRRRAWELPTELTEAGARRLVEDLTALRPSPSAMFCFNNSLARLVLAELDRRGRKVPDELSVLGGGGEDVPGLTCFQADWYELGRRAVQVLSRTATGLAPEHHLMPLTLRPGSTTAPNAE